MSKNVHRTLAYLTTWTLLAWSVRAQEPSAPKPDSSEVLAHIERAKNIAGTVWATEEHFLCEAPHATSAPDPGPAKLFDNLYAIPGQYSSQNGVVYALTTTSGIMLIDSGWRKDVEPVVLGGLKMLGFDPADIKLIIVTHGHPDHYGGSAYLQEHYGARVVLSAADWEFISKPQSARATPNDSAGGVPAVASSVPTRDIVAVEGRPIILGDEKVVPVLIPGHTPGSLGLIFPVKEGGKTHVVGMVGGGFIAQGPPSQVQEFIDSLAHFEQWTQKKKVDVELQNHPVMDAFSERIAALRARKPGEPNPFIVGRENYTKFLEVMTECARATLARRSE
jgi:metallo-beta-lactamase class B